MAPNDSKFTRPHGSQLTESLGNTDESRYLIDYVEKTEKCPLGPEVDRTNLFSSSESIQKFILSLAKFYKPNCIQYRSPSSSQHEEQKRQKPGNSDKPNHPPKPGENQRHQNAIDQYRKSGRHYTLPESVPATNQNDRQNIHGKPINSKISNISKTPKFSPKKISDKRHSFDKLSKDYLVDRSKTLLDKSFELPRQKTVTEVRLNTSHHESSDKHRKSRNAYDTSQVPSSSNNRSKILPKNSLSPPKTSRSKTNIPISINRTTKTVDSVTTDDALSSDLTAESIFEEDFEAEKVSFDDFVEKKREEEFQRMEKYQKDLENRLVELENDLKDMTNLALQLKTLLVAPPTPTSLTTFDQPSPAIENNESNNLLNLAANLSLETRPNLKSPLQDDSGVVSIAQSVENVSPKSNLSSPTLSKIDTVSEICNSEPSNLSQNSSAIGLPAKTFMRLSVSWAKLKLTLPNNFKNSKQFRAFDELIDEVKRGEPQNTGPVKGQDGIEGDNSAPASPSVSTKYSPKSKARNTKNDDYRRSKTVVPKNGKSPKKQRFGHNTSGSSQVSDKSSKNSKSSGNSIFDQLKRQVTLTPQKKDISEVA